MIGKTKKNEYFVRSSYTDPVTKKRVRIYKTGFKTQKEAKEKEYELTHNSSEKKEKKTIYSYEDVARDFLNFKKPDITEKTANDYEAVFRNHIFCNFKFNNILDITTLDCREFYDYLIKSKLASKTKNDILILFKAVFVYASEVYQLPFDPAQFLKSFPKDYDHERIGQIWTIEEFEIFISNFDFTQEIEHRWGTFYTTGYWTGARAGELLALQFKDLNIKDKSISITKTVTQKIKGKGAILKKPKTNSSIRVVSLDEKTLKLLEEEYEIQSKKEGFSLNQFIFCRENNPFKPFANTTIDNKKKKIIEKENLKPIRFHDFRHSHASVLIGNGVNIVAVSARLGHSSVDMTLKIYTHLLPSVERQALEIINLIR